MRQYDTDQSTGDPPVQEEVKAARTDFVSRFDSVTPPARLDRRARRYLGKFFEHSVEHAIRAKNFKWIQPKDPEAKKFALFCVAEVAKLARDMSGKAEVTREVLIAAEKEVVGHWMPKCNYFPLDADSPESADSPEGRSEIFCLRYASDGTPPEEPEEKE